MRGQPVQASTDRKIALGWIDRETALEDPQRAALAEVAAALAGRVRKRGITTAGLCGAPGSGKSTLARLLCHVLESSGHPAWVLGVDDYYLSRADRQLKAQQIHPLFAQRGVPGTHELDLLVADFDHLLAGTLQQAALPRFDKSTDDRDHAAHPGPGSAPAFLLLEGWFVGSAPPPAIPDSPFRDEQDPADLWHRAVWEQWRAFHDAFHSRLQETWYLSDPGWEQVVDWRWMQEQQLPSPRLRNRKAVAGFLETFHGLYQLIRSQLPGRADVVLHLDRDHVLRFSE